MGFTIVGHCPKCGAPIYSETVWFGVGPPPNIRTCNCFAEHYKTITVQSIPPTNNNSNNSSNP